MIHLKIVNFIALFFLGFLLSTCGGAEEELGRSIEIIVVDAKGNTVEGASVTLYEREADFANNRNPLTEPLITNEIGSANFKGLNALLTNCHFSVEKGRLNNWGGKITSRLVDDKIRIVVRVEESLATLIAGRYGKRWRQLYQKIGLGDPFTQPCMSFQLIHVFKRTMQYDLFIPPDCNGGREEQRGTDEWEVNPRNTGINLGSQYRPSSRRITTMIELTEKSMKFFYFPLNNPDGLRIEEAYVAFD